MNNFKIYIFPRFSRNAQQTGIIMSLLIHLVIIIIFASVPLVKIVPHFQTIHITFQNEDFLSASKTAPAAAALQEKRETTLKKKYPCCSEATRRKQLSSRGHPARKQQDNYSRGNFTK